MCRYFILFGMFQARGHPDAFSGSGCLLTIQPPPDERERGRGGAGRGSPTKYRFQLWWRLCAAGNHLVKRLNLKAAQASSGSSAVRRLHFASEDDGSPGPD
jgi:hypothetical protein